QRLKHLGRCTQSSRIVAIPPTFVVSKISSPQEQSGLSRQSTAISTLVHTLADFAAICSTCCCWIWLFTPLMQLAFSPTPTPSPSIAKNGTPLAHGTIMMHPL